MNTDIKITSQNWLTVLGELEDAFEDIPFGQTKYQTKKFVVSSELTPERAYRAIGLNLMSHINELQGLAMEEELRLLEQDKAQHEYDQKKVNQELTEFDIREYEIKQKYYMSNERWQRKLLNDKLEECNALYEEFVKHPKYTRDDIESAEEIYFAKKMLRTIRSEGNGSVEALMTMYLDDKHINDKLEHKSTVNQDSRDIQDIRTILHNLSGYGEDEIDRLLQSTIACTNLLGDNSDRDSNT